MTVMSCSWVALGLVSGVAHSLGLRRAAHQSLQWGPLWGLLRLALVGVVLTTAAIQGFLLPSVLGWSSGFFVTLIAVYGWSQ